MSQQQFENMAANLMREYESKTPRRREFRVPYKVWTLARGVLPRKHRHRLAGGCRPVDNRTLLDLILWRANSVNGGWLELDRDRKAGLIPNVPAKTVYRHYIEWKRRGVFQKLIALNIRYVDRYYGIEWGEWIAKIPEICGRTDLPPVFGRGKMEKRRVSEFILMPSHKFVRC